jgi:hypothetical protein
MEWIPARVTNPDPLHHHFGKEKVMAVKSRRRRNASHRTGGPVLSRQAKSLLAGARKANGKKRPARRRRNARLVKGSAAAKAYMASIRPKRGRGRKKNGPSASGRPGALAAIRANVKTSPLLGMGRRRKNGPKRHRHALHARRRNPSFDLKRSLIESAVLVVGVFAASKIVPMIETQINKITGLNDQTRGYIKILGAAATIVGGNYLADKFGSKLGFDVRPASYAIATYMAISGLKGAGLIDPMSGTLGITGPVTLNGMGGMGGTMGLILPNYMEPNAMLGSIFTDSQLPGPSVAPHNVMQGGMAAVPVMC